MEGYRKFLASVKVDDVVSAGQIVSVSELHSVEQTLQILAQHRITSVPVFSSNNDGKHLLGLVDLKDIVAFILTLYTQDDNTTTIDGTTFTVHDRLAALAQRFASDPVSKVIDASERNPCCTVFGNAPLNLLIEEFGKGLHRAMVYSKDPSCIEKLISQTDVVRFIASNSHGARDALAPILTRTLDELAFNDTELNFGRDSPYTVNEDDITVEAYVTIFISRVSAVGVLNQNGELVGNLSVADLKGITSTNFTDLALPVKEFLKKYSSIRSPIVVSPTMTLESILDILIRERIHRVWVLDRILHEQDVSRVEALIKKEELVGVITMTDVMKILEFYTAAMSPTLTS